MGISRRLDFIRSRSRSLEDANRNIAERIEEAKRKEQEKIDNFWVPLRESEKKHGREKGELRVGDLIGFCYAEDQPMRMKTAQTPDACYRITEIKKSGRVAFRGWDRSMGCEFGNVFKNFDVEDYGYNPKRCVRLITDWGH